MDNALGRRFSARSLLLFALPNIIMMVFLSMYTIVDGIFISRYVGTLALGAVNMSYPLNSLEMAVGIMLASGGSAIIARQLGEGDEAAARRNFSFLILVAVAIGFAFLLFGNLFLDQIIRLLGASAAQFELCKVYTRILLLFAPAFFLQTAFQTLFITAGKPGLGLFATVCGGITNIVLDYVFIGVLGWGIAGAAVATGLGYLVPAVVGLIYFARKRDSALYFVRAKADWRMLGQACFNGSSEMVTNIANAITTFLFNILFLRYWGEDGVASITIVLYFQFVCTAVFFGFSMGVAPVISYKYGAQDHEQLRHIFKICMGFVLLCSAGSYLLSRIAIGPCLRVFTEADSRVFDITMDGFPIYAVCFLFMGLSIFASAMFTAFSDGKVSAIISFARTLVFLVGMLLVLPPLLGETGIWLSVPAAEVLGVAVSVWYLVRKRSVYQY
ncbi:MATE family efflux transporter [Agathobaculum sp.]|uniref:MATE family efflux transporter n=1 Tax=Agathobaculum sp. TaxID=2048138 RepID=UPI002A802AFF|nr:MATE family efflux transporter [Agathobaculum sp.]MDY3619218.1 MATE family efflux transporter [Agathobaculum sp.]